MPSTNPTTKGFCRPSACFVRGQGARLLEYVYLHSKVRRKAGVPQEGSMPYFSRVPLQDDRLLLHGASTPALSTELGRCFRLHHDNFEALNGKACWVQQKQSKCNSTVSGFELYFIARLVRHSCCLPSPLTVSDEMFPPRAKPWY